MAATSYRASPRAESLADAVSAGKSADPPSIAAAIDIFQSGSKPAPPLGDAMADEMISLGAKLKQHARFQPNAPAVSCGETTLSYAELHRRTNRIARGLAALGVKHGDLVTL